MGSRVTIIGAGFAGLTLARALGLRGVPVRVIEAGPLVGGLISTEHTPNGLIETAAPSLNRTERVEKLIQDLELVLMEPSPNARKRLFYVNGEWRSWPLSALESVHFGCKAALSKISGRLPPRENETLRLWAERCLTVKAADRLVATAFQGIYAGDASQLSASLLLGHLFRPGREKFRGVAGVRGGMGALIGALTEAVREQGGEIVRAVRVKPEELPERSVIATSAAAAAELLSVRDPTAAKLIGQIRMLPLVSATAFFHEATGPKAFGGLVRRGENIRALGILLNKEIFPERDELASETWIYGGATDPGVADLTTDQIRKLLLEERRRLFQREEGPVDLRVTVWRRGLPHYDLELERILRELKEPAGILFHGNWLGGIGLSRILERSDRLAERIAREWT